MRTLIVKVGVTKLIVGAVGLMVIGSAVGFLIAGRKAEVSPVEKLPRAVILASVASLSSDQAPLPLVGIVRSKSEATIRTEAQGQVVGLLYELGDYVFAGAIIAEIENSRERGTVLQAEGAVDAAQAALQKISGGTRSEQRTILEANLSAARAGAVTALLGAYAVIENTVRGTADVMFSNPESTKPQVLFTTTDSQAKIDLESMRQALTPTIAWASSMSSSITISSNITQELDRAESELRRTYAFFDVLVRALDAGVPSGSTTEAQMTTNRASAAGARTSVASSLGTLTTSRASLVAAEKNLEQGITGGQSEDVLAAEAAVKQSEGLLASALSSLEKTIIRAPISGTINMLSLERGDFVSVSFPAVTIANNEALEVLTYVTEVDRPDIAVGSSVVIEKNYRGAVTRIAPAADPALKKIEVRVGITGEKPPVTNGQSVSLAIERTLRSAGANVTSDRIVIPISALKILSSGIVVFTVEPDNTLLAHRVVLGPILGEKVVIAEGLDPALRIVTDARGLKEGDTVSVE